MEQTCKKVLKLNPKLTRYMSIEDTCISSIKVIKVNAHNWLYRLIHPNAEPEYKYIIRQEFGRHQWNYSIDDFFADPDNDKLYLRPLFVDGELQDKCLRIKPRVRIWYSDTDCFIKSFENQSDRDQWLKETGLDKETETFITITKQYENE